jgi:hypothetical protein
MVSIEIVEQAEDIRELRLARPAMGDRGRW